MDPKSIKAPPPRRLQSVDWVALRRAFIERPERPLIDDLSKEFGLSADRINRASRDEGWPTLRAAFAQERLKEADAAMAIVNAAKAESAVTRAFTDAALEVCQQVHTVVQDLQRRKVAENTRANTLNTCAFTLSNLANALARVGVVGLPKALKESAGVDNGNGRWNPAMLQALNVTVQNIVGGTAPQAPVAGDSSPSVAEVEAMPAPALAAPAHGHSVTTVTEPAVAVGGRADPDPASLV